MTWIPVRSKRVMYQSTLPVVYAAARSSLSLPRQACVLQKLAEAPVGPGAAAERGSSEPGSAPTGAPTPSEPGQGDGDLPGDVFILQTCC